MSNIQLEHANFTVADAKSAAAELCALFDWKIRWEGEAIHGGHTIHVGTDDSYVAVYTPKGPIGPSPDTYSTRGGLNHIAVVVDDLDAIEARVVKAGLKTHSHADYEPGRRFYFHTSDGVEIEVVCYA